MLWIIVLVLLAIWWLILKWKNRAMVELYNQISCGLKAYPIVGHSYVFFGNDEGRMDAIRHTGRMTLEKGGCVAFWGGRQLYISITDAKIADLVLKSCHEKDDVMKVAHFLIGNGSIFAPVSIWRPRRKILAPTFSPKIVNQFVDIFYKQSSIMVEQLRPNAGKGSFSIWKYITSYTMDSVCESVLGVQVNAQLKPNHPFLTAFDRLCRVGAMLMCHFWISFEIMSIILFPIYEKTTGYKQTISNFIDQIIKKKRKAMSETKTTNDCDKFNGTMKTFMEHIINSSGGTNGYTDVELQEETLVLVLAGTDTSAVGSAFISVMLSRHQDVQQKVYQELQDVLGDSDGPIVAEDLVRLRYLDAVIRETMRLYPPVPVISRKLDRDIELPSGVVLLKGCAVFFNIWATHRNPQYWGPDPEVFRPERFIDAPLKHPAAFMGFSYGPRACLGYQYAMMSMKTAIVSILRKYRIQPVSPSDLELKDEPLRVKFDIMMRHVHRFKVQLELRK